MSLDASRMRIHLRECFVNGHFATFPRAVTPDGFVSVGSERPISSSNPCETVISNRCEDRERKKPEVNTRVCKKRQSSTGVCPVSKTHDETSEFEIALQREFDSFQSVKKNKYLKNSGKTNSGNTYTILNQLSSGEVGITPNEEETIRSRNRIRQQQRRDRLDESQKDLQREMDRKRYRDKQSTMTLNDKRRRTEQNTVKQQLRRHTMTDKEKTLCLEKDRIQHSSARQEMTAEEKTRQREADKLQHRNTREEMPEEEKSRHREANKLQHRNTREEMPEEEKSRHREADKLQHRKTREEMPEEEKSRHREANKLQHRNTREEMPEEEKSRHREADKLQHRNTREEMPEEEKSRHREANKLQHRKTREEMPEEEKSRHREADKLQHRKTREEMPEEEKSRHREANKLQHRNTREEMPEEEKSRHREANKLQHHNTRQEMTDEEKNRHREADKLQHRNTRQKMNEEEKTRERGINKIQQCNARREMTEEGKNMQRKQNKMQHRKARQEMTQEKKIKQCKDNKLQHQQRRQAMSDSAKNFDRARSKELKRRKREEKRQRQHDLQISSSHTAVDEVVQNFMSTIKCGPTYVCCLCYRMLYRTSVKHLSPALKTELCQLSIRLTTNAEQQPWVCLTCANCVSRKAMPAQSLSNNLKVLDTPMVLQRLCNLEKQLISKIIPFMKIFSLPKGSQHGLKGQVVLVPANVQDTANALPRETKDAQLVALNLKRRLSDKTAYCKEYIRPQLVNNALQYLIAENTHYSDITPNKNWTENSEKHDKTLWKAVHSNEDNPESLASDAETINDVEEQDGSPRMTDSEEDIEKDIPENVAEDLAFKRSLNSSTCLYPEQGPIVRSNKVLNIAPAEGQIPTSVFYKPFWESLAFPTLFPDGVNTFHEKRSVTVSPKKYVNARLLSKDFRFAESTEYTFQCLHWVESTTVNDNITLALKKTRQNDISVACLQNPENLQRMFKEDEIFASFKRIRGTPQYWKEMQLDMLAKIRHFGTYTFFISGSAADFHWPELIQIVAKQYGEDFDMDYIEKVMDKKTKRSWLARNPVTIARHIDYIFRKLWGNVILSGVHPIGQILNYDIRKEMQSRGTAHFHSAVHVQNAPKLDRDPDNEVVTFIDKYITCNVPDENNEPLLKDLVTSRQMHHHTRTCKKKKGVECRFHYPKPPSFSTVIARVPCDENAKKKIDHARCILLQVMNTLQLMGTDHSLRDILSEANVSETEYKSATEISLKKTNVILKRDPSETLINPYNAIILKCLRANMDIQYITDVWACVAYITSYMCKPERSMSELMRTACKEAATVKDKLKSIGNVFLKSREVSQHEAIARLVGLPLRETNTPVLFVPTGFKQQRTRLLKPRFLLEKMDDGDTDIFVPNIIDKYAARPSDLENMCLAEFASVFSPCRKTSTQDHDDLLETEGDITKETIRLRDNLGTLRKRKTPLVLRDFLVSKQRDKEKYFHRLLLLYLHWRDEDELEDYETFEAKFKQVQHSIEENLERFEPYLEEVQQASEDLELLELNDDEIWDRLAPQAEQNRDVEGELEVSNQMLDTDNLSTEQLIFQQEQTESTGSQGTRRSTISTNINLEPNSKYYTMVRTLNHRQREIHDHIFAWCRRMALATSECEEPSPFHIFLSGGAGVGKSHVVHTIYQSAVRCLRKPGENTELPSVVLTAPTGKAAVNIGGTTLHSAFRLPVKQRGRSYEYKHQSSTTLNAMRVVYSQMKILIIDEISMVGATTLSNLNISLQDIFEKDLPFGNKAVLAVGDLMQLNPVGERPVYKEHKSGYAALASSVWRLFKLFELGEIVRQKEDPEFAQLLSRVRIGKQTQQDVIFLKTLEQNNEVPKDALSVFLTNELKDAYNNDQLTQLSSKVYTIKARDSKRDLRTGRIAVNVTSTNPHETGGLAGEIQVALTAKYMQTKNVDIEDGLVNGATGTIMKLDISDDDPLAGAIYVRFDDPQIGKQAKKHSPYKGLVPIRPISATFPVTEKSTTIQVERMQFPGTLAWGITVHKSQGSTFEQMVGDMTTPAGRTNTMPGQIYTMLSRAKSAKGLKVCSFTEEKIKVNTTALQEMELLQTSYQLHTETFHRNFGTPSLYVTLAYLNIRSLREHYVDLVTEVLPGFSGFLCFSETNVYRYSKYMIKDMKVLTNSIQRHKHGTVIYSTFVEAEELPLESESVEIVAVVAKEIIVAALYNPPGRAFDDVSRDVIHLVNQIQAYISERHINKTVILGDFNISFQQMTSLAAKLETYGLFQIVSKPTHQLGAILDLAFTNITDYTMANIPVVQCATFPIAEELLNGVKNPKVVSVAESLVSPKKKRISVQGILRKVSEVMETPRSRRRELVLESTDGGDSVSVKLWGDKTDLECSSFINGVVNIHCVGVSTFKGVTELESTVLTEVMEVAEDSEFEGEVEALDFEVDSSWIVVGDWTLKVSSEMLKTVFPDGEYIEGIVVKGKRCGTAVLEMTAVNPSKRVKVD